MVPWLKSSFKPIRDRVPRIRIVAMLIVNTCVIPIIPIFDSQNDTKYFLLQTMRSLCSLACSSQRWWCECTPLGQGSTLSRLSTCLIVLSSWPVSLKSSGPTLFLRLVLLAYPSSGPCACLEYSKWPSEYFDVETPLGIKTCLLPLLRKIGASVREIL